MTNQPLHCSTWHLRILRAPLSSPFPRCVLICLDIVLPTVVVMRLRPCSYGHFDLTLPSLTVSRLPFGYLDAAERAVCIPERLEEFSLPGSSVYLPWNDIALHARRRKSCAELLVNGSEHYAYKVSDNSKHNEKAIRNSTYPLYSYLRGDLWWLEGISWHLLTSPL